MLTDLVHGTCVPVSFEADENLLILQLDHSRLKIRGLANFFFGNQAIQTLSDRDILLFRHEFTERRVQISPEAQQIFLDAFQEYWGFYSAYIANAEAGESTKDVPGSIDPSLVEDRQSSAGDLWIVQQVKSLFYFITRWKIGEENIERYQGRVTVFEPEKICHLAVEKVFSEVFPIPTDFKGHENLLMFKLDYSRSKIRELANYFTGSQSIPELSDRDIFLFMHQFQEHLGAGTSPEAQQIIWGAFQEYWKLYCAYSAGLDAETVESTKDVLRAIDPSLIGESQWNEGDFWVVQQVKSLFYSVTRWMAGEDLIEHYQGRLSVLLPREVRRSEIAEVLEIFSDVFPTVEVSSLGDVDRFLRTSSDTERRIFEERLSVHFDGMSTHFLLNRTLTDPASWQSIPVAQEIEVDLENYSQLSLEERESDEEFTYDFVYEADLSQEPSLPTFVPKDFEQEEVGQEAEKDSLMSWGNFVSEINSSFIHKNFKEQDIREIKALGERGFEMTFLDGTVLNVQKTEEGKLHLSGTALPHLIQEQFNQALGRGSENVFPFDQIESVTVLSEGSSPKLKIDFSREVQGMVNEVSSDGWEDMPYHRLVVGPSLVVQISNQGGIQFEQGNIQMGLHIENFSSLLGIVGLGSTASWTVSNLLYGGGFTDWHGRGKKGLEFAVKIDRITADKNGKVCLTISLPDPEKMVKPRGNHKSSIEVIDLSTTEEGTSWVRKFLGSLSFSGEEYQASFSSVTWS